VAGSRAYAIALDRRTTLIALCLDAETGALLWQRPLAHVDAVRDVFQFAFEFFYFDAAQPSVCGHAAVFPTGQGLVAACDAESGELLWMARYPERRIALTDGAVRITVPAGTWAARQPLITEDVCVVAPTDSDHLVAFELGTGEMKWKRRLPEGYALLGAAPGRVYVQGESVMCLDLAEGRELWRAGKGWVPAGRGAAVAELIYVPTLSGVQRVRRQDGTVLEPLTLPGGRVPQGNSLLLREGLVLVGAEELVFWSAEAASGP
jgi:outer membrane protein assembly factor BamB